MEFGDNPIYFLPFIFTFEQGVQSSIIPLQSVNFDSLIIFPNQNLKILIGSWLLIRDSRHGAFSREKKRNKIKRSPESQTGSCCVFTRKSPIRIPNLSWILTGQFLVKLQIYSVVTIYLGWRNLQFITPRINLYLVCHFCLLLLDNLHQSLVIFFFQIFKAAFQGFFFLFLFFKFEKEGWFAKKNRIGNKWTGLFVQ